MRKRRLKATDNVAQLLAEIKAKEDAMSNTTATELVTVQTKQTVWSQRIDSAKDWLSSSILMKSSRTVKHTIQTSDSTVFVKARELQQTIAEQLEDWRMAYDTSQHPLVYKIRDLQDKVWVCLCVGVCVRGVCMAIESDH